MDYPQLVESPVGWERPPSLSCVICSMPRSGSHLLGCALEDTGLAGHPQEYFGGRHEVRYAEEFGFSPRYTLSSYLKRLAAESMTPNDAWGTQVHLFDFMDLIGRAGEEFGATLSERELLEICFPNPRCIFIRRADRVRQAISWMRAADSGQWQRQRGEPVSERMAQLDIDLDEVDGWVQVFGEQETKWREFFARNNLPYYELSYENLVSDYQLTVAGALDFLGLMPPDGLRLPPPRLEKQSDALTERAVASYRNRVRQPPASQPEKHEQRRTPAEEFQVMHHRLQRPAQALADTTASYLFKLSGPDGGDFHVLLQDGTGSAGPGSLEHPDLTVALSADDFMAMTQGDLDVQFAYITGRITIRGDWELGLLLNSLMTDD